MVVPRLFQLDLKFRSEALFVRPPFLFLFFKKTGRVYQFHWIQKNIYKRFAIKKKKLFMAVPLFCEWQYRDI